jgi:hypothetical protein
MDYLTKYYKNLSEELQEQVFILESVINEARLKSPETIRREGRNNPLLQKGATKRAQEREDLFGYLLSQLGERNPDIDKKAAERVIRDVAFDGQVDAEEADLLAKTFGDRGDSPSTSDDLKHILSTYRREYHSDWRNNPNWALWDEEERLNKARERTYKKYNK